MDPKPLQPARRFVRDEKPNEIGTMKALFEAGSDIAITTTVDETKFFGRIAWYDLHNIALVIGKETKVFPKSQIVTWAYDSKSIAA